MDRIDDDSAWTPNSWRGEVNTGRSAVKPVTGLGFARGVSKFLRVLRVIATVLAFLTIALLCFAGVRAATGDPMAMIVDPNLVLPVGRFTVFLAAAYVATWAAAGYLATVIATAVTGPHGLHQTYTPRALIWTFSGLLSLPIAAVLIDWLLWWASVTWVPVLWPGVVGLMTLPVHIVPAPAP